MFDKRFSEEKKKRRKQNQSAREQNQKPKASQKIHGRKRRRLRVVGKKIFRKLKSFGKIVINSQIPWIVTFLIYSRQLSLMNQQIHEQDLNLARMKERLEIVDDQVKNQQNSVINQAKWQAISTVGTSIGTSIATQVATKMGGHLFTVWTSPKSSSSQNVEEGISNSELSRISNEVSDLRQSMDRQSKTNQTVEEENLSLKERIESQKKDFESQKNHLQDLQNEYSQARNYIIRQQTQLSKLESQLISLIEEFNKESMHANDQITNLSHQLERIGSDKTELLDQVEALKKNNFFDQTQIKKIELMKKTIEQDLRDSQNQNQESKKLVQDLKKNMQKSESRLSDFQDEITNLQSENELLSEEFSNYKSKQWFKEWVVRNLHFNFSWDGSSKASPPPQKREPKEKKQEEPKKGYNLIGPSLAHETKQKEPMLFPPFAQTPDSHGVYVAPNEDPPESVQNGLFSKIIKFIRR